MRIKMFARLLCTIVIAASMVNCRQQVDKNQKGVSKMSKPTIEQVQKKYQDQWMGIPGVVGVGIGAADSTPVIKVMVVKATPELERKIPRNIEGYQVVIEETGEFRALEKK